MERNAFKHTLLFSALALTTGLLGYGYIQYYWPLVVHAQETASPASSPSALVNVNEKENVDYQFYSMLQEAPPAPVNAKTRPEDTAAVPSPAAPPKPRVTAITPITAITPTKAVTPIKAQPSGRFFLQIASFKTAMDAQRLYQQLQRKGLEARVIHVTLHGNPWYRLVTGHYLTKKDAAIAKQRLQQQGLSSIILQSSNGD